MTIELSENVINAIADAVVKKMQEPKAEQKWISVSERLPESGESVLVWYEYYKYGDYNGMYETYGIGFYWAGQWGGDVSGRNARCIAWMPLPQPYKAESEEEE